MEGIELPKNQLNKRIYNQDLKMEFEKEKYAKLIKRH